METNLNYYEASSVNSLPASVRNGYRVVLFDYENRVIDIADYKSLDDALINTGYNVFSFNMRGYKVCCQRVYYVRSGLVSSVKKTYYL